MRSMTLRLTGILLVALLIAAVGGAQDPGGVLVGPVNPAVTRIAKAAAIKDPALREVALHEAIEKGLLESDLTTSSVVSEFLVKNSFRWLDLLPFEDILARYRARVTHDNKGEEGFPAIAYNHISRSDNIRVTREALEQGMAIAPGGAKITRLNAIRAVADNGLAELLPEAMKAYGMLPRGLQQIVFIRRVSIEANLKAGCDGREDCAEQAANRLAAMTDEDFEKKMETDKDFPGVVMKVSDYACTPNPFTGWVNPGCQQIHKIYERQVVLKKRVDAERRAEGLKPQLRPCWSQLGWLDDFKRWAHYNVAPPNDSVIDSPCQHE